MSDKKILAVIPARGGSKGLPRKNIIDLAGRPLIAWTIEAALASKYVTTTVVSSEDDEILSVAAAYGAETVRRPGELALDTTASEPVITHALKEMMKRQNETFDYVVLLQPTSPLRSAEDLDAAFEELLQSDADALISVCQYDKKVLKTFLRDEAGYLHGIANDRYPFMRRQDLPDVLMPNGAIYIIETGAFLKEERLFTDKTLPYIMSDESSVDVDTLEDLKMIEQIIAVS